MPPPPAVAPQLVSMLQSLRLSRYIPLFATQEIDLEVRRLRQGARPPPREEVELVGGLVGRAVRVIGKPGNTAAPAPPPLQDEGRTVVEAISSWGHVPFLTNLLHLLPVVCVWAGTR